MTIILLALLGVVISIVVGTVWHMPQTWGGRIHMAYLGFDKLTKEEQDKKIEAAKPHMWKTYLAQAGLSFLTSVFIAFVMTMTVRAGQPATLVYGYVAMIWLGFTVPVIGGNLLWANCERGLAIKKFISDILYNLITVLLITFVFSFII